MITIRKMTILVIDDERIFNHEKIGALTDHFAYAESLTVATALVFTLAWDVVYLDHDLGTYGDVRVLTKDIEKFAYNGNILPIGKFVIHSMNPLGRMEMYNALHKFYNVEFARVEDLL